MPTIGKRIIYDTESGTQREEEYEIPDLTPEELQAKAEADIFIAKQEAAERIESGFRNAIQNGSMISESQAGFEVDVRRNDRDNDIDNIRGAMKRINAGRDTSPTYWVGKTDVKLLTLAELEILELEMLDYGAAVYLKKHTLEYQLANCTTIAEYEAVVW